MIISEKRVEAGSAGSVVAVLRGLLWQEDIASREREHFYVVGLDADCKTKYVELAFLGGLVNCYVHPREVFRLAIIRGCHSIITAHNHPGGNVEPSINDRTMFNRLNEVGKLIGIECVDHIVFSEHKHYSVGDFTLWPMLRKTQRARASLPKVHYRMALNPDGSKVPACSAKSERVTSDKEKVTCRRCLGSIKAERAKRRQIELAGTRPFKDLPKNSSEGDARDIAAREVNFHPKNTANAKKPTHRDPQDGMIYP